MTKIIKVPIEFRNFLLGIIISVIYLLLPPHSKERFKSLIIKAILPEPTVSKKVFSTLSKVILFLSFLTIVVISSPLYLNSSHPFFISDSKSNYINDNFIFIKQWTSYLSFILEIILIFFLSGAIFSETMSAKFKNQIVIYQNNRNTLLEKKLEGMPVEIKTSYNNVDKLFSELNHKNFFNNAGNKYKAIAELADKTFYEVPDHLRRFMLIKFYSSFPGGLYGVISFILFLFLSLTNIFLMYLDLPIFNK